MASSIKKLETGIKGLDELTGGGIPENHLVLVAGGPGSGKTILGMQFAVYGAMKGEKSVYIAFEEKKPNLYAHALAFGWDLEKLEKDKKLKIIEADISKTNIVQLMKMIEMEIKSFEPKRVVLDSLSILSVYAEIIGSAEVLESMGISSKSINFSPSSESITRRTVVDVINKLKDWNLTGIIIAEAGEGASFIARDGVSPFVADGVIKLSTLEALGKRTFTLVKMRGVKHSFLPKTMEITERGIEVK